MISRFRSACISAVLVQLVVGWVDGVVYVTQHGIPDVAFPLLVMVVYGVTGLGIGTAVACLAGNRVDVRRWATFVSMAFSVIPWVFTRVLPESIEIGTVLGLAVFVVLLGTSYGVAGAWARSVGRVNPVRWIRVALAGAVLVSLLSWARQWRDPFPGSIVSSTDPDILVLVMDTLRADHAGSDRMPALASLAEDGVVFERALSVSCFTPPPHASLLTGNYPVRHGVRGGQRFLADANQTLGEILSDRGYATIGVVSNLSLASVFGWDQGFGIYDDSLVSSVSPGAWLEKTPAIVPWIKLGFSPRLPLLRLAHGLGMIEAVDAGATVDHVLAALDRAGDRPVFAFVNFMDPHFPYRTPAQRGNAEVDRVNDALEPVLRSVGHAGSGVKAQLAEQVPSLYDGEVRYLDSELRRLMDSWRSRGRWDRSLVVVTADHGEHLGDHDRYFHTNSLYRELVHVPLIFRFPVEEDDAHRGSRVSEVVSLVDVAPTILDWIDASGGEEMQGQSLLTRLGGQESQSRTVASEWNESRAIAWDTYKAFFENGDLVSVVDIAGDETVDLVGEQPGLAAEAVRKHGEWEATFANTGSIEPARQEVDPVMQERLRALGYVE